jgi:hypothetical protein
LRRALQPWPEGPKGTDLGQAAVRADAPAVHLPRVSVERVEEASVRADRLVADSCLAQARRRGDCLGELDPAVFSDAELEIVPSPKFVT